MDTLPCWVYFINYIEETDNETKRYCVVKDRNGSLLEINTTNNDAPDDLTEWRAVKWIEIPYTEYALNTTSCQWTNLESNKLIVINSDKELEDYILCTSGNYPAIDFEQYALVLAHGHTDYGRIASIAKSLIQLAANEYIVNIGIHLQDTVDSQQWYIAMLIPKIAQNAIRLNVYYPHISVWEYFYVYNDDPHVTITLTLDTLRNYFYVSTIPQDLENYRPRTSFLFGDGMEGKYFSNKDTMCFYGFFDYGSPYDYFFIQTIISQDSMLLHYRDWVDIYGITIIRDFLFIRQPNF